MEAPIHRLCLPSSGIMSTCHHTWLCFLQGFWGLHSVFAKQVPSHRARLPTPRPKNILSVANIQILFNSLHLNLLHREPSFPAPNLKIISRSPPPSSSAPVLLYVQVQPPLCHFSVDTTCLRTCTHGIIYRCDCVFCLTSLTC